MGGGGGGGVAPYPRASWLGGAWPDSSPSWEDAGIQLAGPRGGMLSSPSLRGPKRGPPPPGCCSGVTLWQATPGAGCDRCQWRGVGVLGGGVSGPTLLPAALAPGERTRLWAPALCGVSALIPGGAGTVLPVAVAVAVTLVRSVGELAEFVLQVGDAFLLRLDHLLQGTDFFQHLLQGWPLQMGGGEHRWGDHWGAPSSPSKPTTGGEPAPAATSPIPRTLTEKLGSQVEWLWRRPGGGLLSRIFFLTTFSSRFLMGT